MPKLGVRRMALAAPAVRAPRLLHLDGRGNQNLRLSINPRRQTHATGNHNHRLQVPELSGLRRLVVKYRPSKKALGKVDVEGGGGDVAPQASASTSHSLSRCAPCG